MRQATVGMTTCLWLSRHEPLLAQRRALERHFPGCQWLMDSDIFVDAADIVKRVDKARNGNGASVEVAIVAPLSLIQKLIERGIRPLWPVMRQVLSDHPASLDWYRLSGDPEPPLIVPIAAEYWRAHTDSCVLAPRGRVLEFVKFRRLVGIHMELEEL